MAIPVRTGAAHYHYHVYDIPCGHVGGGGHGGGCGPHVQRTQFSSVHVNSWLPPVAAAPGAAAHQARADAATRTREEAPLRDGGAGAGPVNITVHPNAAGDQTGNARLSLLQDMEDLQTVAGAVAPLNAVSASIGTTHFGRDIPYIMFGGNNNPAAPQVLLTGGVHAREWIAVEVPYLIAEYMIKNYLITVQRGGQPASQVRMSQVIDACRICVIPMLNPDGHCWSVAAGNRLWRKNRRRWTKTQLITDYPNVYTKATFSKKLQYKNDQNKWATPARTKNAFQDKIGGNRVFFGVDCNRNCWQAGVAAAANPQPDPTVETYAGPASLTEGETSGLDAFLDANLAELAASIDYHSAMGRVLYHEEVANLPALERTAITHVAGCMRDHIDQYSVHGAGIFLNPYPAATTIPLAQPGANSIGSIMDLCYQKMISNSRIPLVYTIELDPIKNAGYNPACNAADRWFRIPPASIQAVFEKNLTAALCLMEYATLNPRTLGAAARGINGTTIAQRPCPFRPAGGGGGGGNDMVAHIAGRGNQPPT